MKDSDKVSTSPRRVVVVVFRDGDRFSHCRNPFDLNDLKMKLMKRSDNEEKDSVQRKGERRGERGERREKREERREERGERRERAEGFKCKMIE